MDSIVGAPRRFAVGDVRLVFSVVLIGSRLQAGGGAVDESVSAMLAINLGAMLRCLKSERFQQNTFGQQVAGQDVCSTFRTVDARRGSTQNCPFARMNVAILLYLKESKFTCRFAAKFPIFFDLFKNFPGLFSEHVFQQRVMIHLHSGADAKMELAIRYAKSLCILF
jgi:hypothetical protein